MSIAPPTTTTNITTTTAHNAGFCAGSWAGGERVGVDLAVGGVEEGKSVGLGGGV